MIGPVRLRRGKAADVRGAASFVTESIAVARQAGASGPLLLRADSKFYTADVVAACRRGGAHLSLSTGINRDITATISKIPDEDWVDIEYPNPIEDPDTGALISKARVARTVYTAFKSRRKRERADGWLMLRRVLRDNAETAQGQGELFNVYRYHPVITDNPAPLVKAETCHRQHAIIEPQIAELKHSALAHLPSASFQANNAWLTPAAMAHNLTRAAGRAASPFHARAETATIRAHLASVLAEYTRHYNDHRPHRGINLDVPMPAPMATVTTLPVAGRIERVDVLGGLTHEYRRAA